jgi:phosphopantothenoylcysteine decarboxylase/phosphopantothenate--cysteine ligase
MADLDHYEIILGISGGIAAFKIATVCSLLTQHGCNVTVCMTENAKNFIAPLTFSTLTNNQVMSDLFDPRQNDTTTHIHLARKTDLLVIAPATGNIIAKMAHGIADTLLSTFILCAQSPILVAPAMNTHMYHQKAMQRNLDTIIKDGVHIIGPEDGDLACGDVGPGRMSEPEAIFEKISELLKLSPPKSNA